MSLSKMSEKVISWDVFGGIYTLVPTVASANEKGEGKLLGGDLYLHTDDTHLYKFGIQLNWDKNSGGDFFDPSENFRKLLVVGRGEQSKPWLFSSRDLHLGFRTIEGKNTLEVGSEVNGNFILKPSGSFPTLAISPYLATIASLPLDKNQAANIPLREIRLGVNLRLMNFNESKVEPSKELNSYDVSWFVYSQGHGFLSNYATMKGLASPSSEVQEFTGELFDDEETQVPSSRLEGASSIIAIQNFLDSGKEGDDLSLMLQGNSDQRGVLATFKVLAIAAHFLFASKDESSLMMSKGIAGALQMINYWTASDMKKSKEKSKDFLGLRLVLNGAAFLVGHFTSFQGLIEGSQQALMGTANGPDALQTGLEERTVGALLYEYSKNGNLVGVSKRHYLNGSKLYTEAGVLINTSPISYEATQEFTDEITGHDPKREKPEAKAYASFGMTTRTDSLILGAGVRSLISFGRRSKPLPGVGAEGSVILSFSLGDSKDAPHLDFGAKLALDYMGGSVEPSLTPFVGLSF